MKRLFGVATLALAFSSAAFSQSKTLIGIVPFKESGSNNNGYGLSSSGGNNAQSAAIQDAVANAFLKTKRFSLVEREKMDQLTTEKNLQKTEDFIDGSVIEQSKSLGAQYVVLGNISKSDVERTQRSVNLPVPFVNASTTNRSEVGFSIRVVDVTTSEIIASSSFSNTAKGKNAFEDALKELEPQIEKFIKENFKLTASIASIEEKTSGGDAAKVLLAAGSNVGIKEKDEFKVYEVTQMEVDGKKLTRKKTIGTITVVKVEDENFSLCKVKEGGADISQKIAAGAKIKCEITTN